MALALSAVIFSLATAGLVQERQVTSCNTPCGTLQLACPQGHRLAIREALFAVRARTPPDLDSCLVTQSCGTERYCCDQSQPQACTFSYAPSHLQAVHRNCSGAHACVIKTERTPEETVACPFFRPNNTVSHTVLDYVCINDSASLDLCAYRESQLVGRTLFALLDPDGWRSPLSGAVCRCTAESVRWPTTTTISVFVVDLRLNVPRQSLCSQAEVRLRSGSSTRLLDCQSSHDPRQAFPFVALLNHSNVATLELVLNTHLPELLWIGFESSEAEDIRLSCGMQGYARPGGQDSPTLAGLNGSSADWSSDSGSVDAGAIAGGVVGSLLVLALLVALIVFLLTYRKGRAHKDGEDYSQPRDTLGDGSRDGNVYYSSPDLYATDGRYANSGPKTRDYGTRRPTTANTSQGTGLTAEGEETGEMYVTAEVVRERKRKSGKKRVRIVSTPEELGQVGEYYSSPWDAPDSRRRLTPPTADLTPPTADHHGSDDDDVFDPPALPPPLGHPSVATGGVEDYAVLARGRRGEGEEESYDHIPAAVRGQSKVGVHSSSQPHSALLSHTSPAVVYDRPRTHSLAMVNGSKRSFSITSEVVEHLATNTTSRQATKQTSGQQFHDADSGLKTSTVHIDLDVSKFVEKNARDSESDTASQAACSKALEDVGHLLSAVRPEPVGCHNSAYQAESL